MSNFMGDIVAKLRADATLGALLKTPGHVWHRRAPQSAGLPRVILTRPSEGGRSHLTGPSDMRQPLVVVDAIAATPAASQAVADRVDAYLNGFRGTLGDYFVSGFTLEDQRDSDNEAVYGGGSEERRCVTSTDYLVAWR